MITLTHTVTTDVGMHARPAGQLAKIARRMSTSSISAGGAPVELAKIFDVLGLGITRGDTITITLEGSDEASAAAEVTNILMAEL